MDIAVIITTYNRKSFVVQALDSVLQQTCRVREVCVVDDGSTDGTCQVLSGRGGCVYTWQENRGVSSARNRGIEKTRSEWICFLDSDDMWDKRKVSYQVSFHEQHPDILVSQTEEIWVRHGVRVNQMKKHAKPSGDIFLDCLPMCMITPSSVMIHRSVFDDVGTFNEAYPACEDYELWLRIALRYKVGLIEIPLITKYGGHLDQLSRQHSLDAYRIRALVDILPYVAQDTNKKREVLKEIERKCIIYITGCKKRGKIEEAKEFELIKERMIAQMRE